MLWVDVQGLCPISMGEAVFLGYYSSFCRVKGLSLHQALWGPPPAPHWHQAQDSLAPLSPQGLPGGAEVCFQSLPSPSPPPFLPQGLGQLLGDALSPGWQKFSHKHIRAKNSESKKGGSGRDSS